MSTSSTHLRRRFALVAVAVAVLAVSACEPSPAPARLLSGATLASGGSLVAPGGRAQLTMEANGNLVARIDGGIVWTSGTAGNPGAKLIMRTQGNLAVVTTSGSTGWSSPATVSGSSAALTQEGNLVQEGSAGQPYWANGAAAAGGSRVPASQRTVSTQQVTLTKMYEGYVSGTPYNDYLQNCTVGYGHLIHAGACTDTDRAKTWDADALFAVDVTEHARRLKSTLGTVPMTQREFDALWDYVYNRGSLTASNSPGTYAAMTSSPPRYGDVPAVLQAAGDASSQGLCHRRYDEAQTFAGGDYARNYVC